MRLLESLAGQDAGQGSFEVIVVLDGSTDDSGAVLRSRQWPFALHVIEQPNRGPSAARNAGLVQATGRILLFLDNDTECIPGALSAHLAAHADGVPRVVLGDLLPVNVPRGYPRHAVSWIKPWNHPDPFVPSGMHGAAVFGANLSVPRASVPEGGFREDMRRLEDTEFGLRCEAAGLPIGCVRAGAVRLHGVKSLPGAMRDAETEGELMARLWKHEPALVEQLSRGGRRCSPFMVRLIRLSAVTPIPGVIPRAIGAIPHALPGATTAYRACRTHAYLRGVRRALLRQNDWTAYLNRRHGLTRS